MVEADRALYESHPDLGHVLGNGSALIAAALDPSLELVSEARPMQVRFIPGRSVVAQFSASVAAGDGESIAATFVASVGRNVPDGTALVSSGGTDVAVWRVPADPFLPGLASVASPDLAGRLLEQLGVDSTGITVRRRAYRPTRRAVMELRTPSHRVFAKVVRPSKVAELQKLHTSLVGQAPIPASLGWSEMSGIAMLQALEGHSLRWEVEKGGGPLPSSASVIDLLGTLEGVPGRDGPRQRLVDRATDHAVFIGTVYPELLPRVQRLARSIEDVEIPEQLRTIHGDFHSSQIMVRDGTITGLVDIDTVGSGERADDLANLLAHLAALASASPRYAHSTASYGADLTSGFDVVTDPRQLRVRVAAALLGYGTGPFRIQEPEWRMATEERVRLAEDWLDTATAIPL